MYLMVIASSTYASVGLKFKSIQPSTLTVGTIAELSGEYTAAVTLVDTSVANVGTTSTCTTVVTSMFVSEGTDDSIVGTTGSISASHTTMFASNDAVLSSMTINEPPVQPGTLDTYFTYNTMLLNGE